MRVQSILLAGLTIMTIFGVPVAVFAQSNDGATLASPDAGSCPAKATSSAEDGGTREAPTASGNFAAASGKPAWKRGARKHATPGFAKIQHGPMARLKAIKSLDSLTAEQNQQMDSILNAFRKEAKPLREQLAALRRESEAAKLTNGKSTESQTAGVVTNSGKEIRAQLKSKAKEAMEKVFALLTSEQKQQLQSQSQSPTTRKQSSPAESFWKENGKVQRLG